MEVNLIPEKLRPRTANPLPYIVVGTLCAVSIPVMIYGVLWAGEAKERCSKYSRDVNEFQKQLKGKDEVEAQVRRLQEQIEETEGQLSSLSDVIVSRIVWSRVMLELAKAIPPNLALKELSYSGTGATCELAGTSASPTAGPDVARFATDLRMSKYIGRVFRTVKIESCSSGTAEPSPRTAFSLSMALREDFQPVALAMSSEEGADGEAE